MMTETTADDVPEMKVGPTVNCERGAVESPLKEVHETLANLMPLLRRAACGRRLPDLLPALR
jgi:hypothetical protein